MDEVELLALVADDGAERAAFAADRALLGLVDGARVRTIDDIVAEETQGRDIPDTARVGLVVHLALAVRRMQQHDAIVMDAETLGELRRTEEFTLARMIAAQLGKVFSLSVPEAEIGYITMHLLGARGTALPAGAGRVDNFRLVQIAQSIMRLASEKSGAPLIRSRTLLSGLVNHLAPALHRLKLHMDIRNPLLVQMEAEHPELMELARYSTRMMEEEVGTPLPADETAYIAIHIGAALTEAGGGSPRGARARCVPYGTWDEPSARKPHSARVRAYSRGGGALLPRAHDAGDHTPRRGLRCIDRSAPAAPRARRRRECVSDRIRSGTDRRCTCFLCAAVCH